MIDYDCFTDSQENDVELTEKERKEALKASCDYQQQRAAHLNTLTKKDVKVTKLSNSHGEWFRYETASYAKGCTQYITQSEFESMAD